MHPLPLFLTLLAPASPAHDTTFWDGNWHRVQRPNAVYYSWTTPLDSGRCRMQSFYLTGERQMEAGGWLGPPVAKDGPATYYFRSGGKSAAGQFANGRREGRWYYWNEDGTLRRQQVWHADHAVLAKTFAPNANKKVRVVRTIVEQMPKFLGPLPLGQYLAATIRRPDQVPTGGGKVFVAFVVGPQGNITSTQIIKGFDPACDAEALRAVAALPRWQPGLHNGEPTAVSFTVPIEFR